MRDNHTLLDRLADSRQLPELLTDLQQQVGALDAWRLWANGGHISRDGAMWTLEILDSIDDPHRQALAKALASISPDLIAEPDAPAFRFGRDLEAGLEL